MRRIRHTTTLVYYDGPQVFEARDAIGGHYVAVAVEPDGSPDRYLVAGVSPERLRQFRVGALDLRSLLADRDDDEWFMASLGAAPDYFLDLETQDSPLAASPHLPDPGFLLHERPAEVEALREARARNNLVFEVAVDPPESAEEHRIHVGTLAGLLAHIQTLVKHAYGAALRELDPRTRRAIDRSDAHLLDVFVPAAAGSFRIAMEAAKLPNLLGQSEVARALERIDALFADVADPQATLALVKEHRGHLAGAYLRLLRFLAENRSGLHYAWAQPTFAQTRERAISDAQAGTLVDVLSSVSNLGAETVVLVGSLKKADVDSGSWRIAGDEGDSSGTIKQGGPGLAGLRIEGPYRFTCLEEIEEGYGGREKRSLYLIEHEPA